MILHQGQAALDSYSWFPNWFKFNVYYINYKLIEKTMMGRNQMKYSTGVYSQQPQVKNDVCSVLHTDAVLSIRAGSWPKQAATGQSLAGYFSLT